MAATDLSFSKNEENKYVASFVSEGPVTIQGEETRSRFAKYLCQH